MLSELLDELIERPAEPRPFTTLDDWWDHLQSLPADPVTRALLGGFTADRLGAAFVSGYHAATRRMFGRADRLAFCATEVDGNHPRAIATRLTEGRLSGTKTFVTLGAQAEWLAVVATTGSGDDGRPRLKVALLPANAPGVEMTPGPALPFVPEIPHAVVTLSDAPAAEVLPRDGYTGALKPFRTVEDIFVHAALVGYLVQIARRTGGPGRTVAALLASAAALTTLAGAEPLAVGTHLALAGEIARLESLRDVMAPLWRRLDTETRARWERDRPLLQIAGRARNRRLHVACSRAGLEQSGD